MHRPQGAQPRELDLTHDSRGKKHLLARACDGELTSDEAAHLLAACRRDPELRAKLGRLTVVERLLSHDHLYPDDGAFVREVRARLEEAAKAKPEGGLGWRLGSLSRRLPRGLAASRTQWAWAAAAAVVAVGLAVWWASSRSTPEAYIAREESATWDASRVAPKVGDKLDSRRLHLESGLVELKFDRGAIVIVEGPADFEVLGPQHAYLHRGRVVTRLAKGTRGFILDSPRGRLVDQGTEFGVSVGASGDTEVHVLEGKVQAAPTRQPTVQLAVNQAARLTTQRVEQFTADAGGFITDLPPTAEGVLDFLHWSFDEGRGDVSFNKGHGLGSPQAKALLRTYPEGRAGPRWISGQFGAGLSFNGKDDFVECEFPGIPGGEPRTVAFWVKVPRDSNKEEGYGIVNWGTHRPGLAWQISVNPQQKEGPLGRLRAGVHDGYVVGTTDLRDDRWHHCAVVMYGGHRPDSGTHILLYLDGELEPAARKAVMEVRTEISGGDAHNMWLGRNLAYGPPRNDASMGRFFRGSIDELFVFNVALDQDQIRSLMKYNRPDRPPQITAQAGVR